MIVEDEAIVAEEIKTNLEGMGYSVTAIVKTGESAIEKAEIHRPNAILMDIRLEGQIDGIEAAEHIRSLLGIPVIFLTAHADEERLDRAKLTLPFGYLVKPIQDQNLKITIEMALYTAKIDTERKQAEAALLESEELHRITIGNISDAVFITDNTGAFTFICPNVEVIFGYSYDEVDAFGNIAKLLGNRLADGNELISLKEIQNIECKIKDKAGRTHVLLVNVKHVSIKGGTMLYTCRDITDRKKAEDALQKAHDDLERQVEERTKELNKSNKQLTHEIEERKIAEKKLQKSKTMLQAVFDGISDPLVLMNKDMTVAMLNKAALEYYRVGSKDVFDQPCYKTFKERENPCGECEIPIAVMESRSMTFERKGFMDHDKIEQVVVYPIGENDSNAGSAVVHISDITQTKLMQQQLIQSEKLASVGELAAGVAHEINNPINGIINYAQILIDEAGDKADEADLPERIQKEGERIARIVKNLLSFSRQTDDEIGPVSIHTVVSDTLELVGKQLNNDGIHIKIAIKENLPKINVNSQRIQQVLVNLFSNARYALNRKYPGTHTDKTLQIKGEELKIEGKAYVQISVLDRGIGIPSEIIDRICDPFFTNKPRTQGTGLGLSISYGIIQDLGGNLSFESKQGEYTKAIMDLPAVGM